MNIKRFFAMLLVITCLASFLTGCGLVQIDDAKPTDAGSDKVIGGFEPILVPDDMPNIDDNKNDNRNDTQDVDNNTDDKSNAAEKLEGVGEILDNTGIEDGKFEGTTTEADFTVTYVSGTKNAYSYSESTKTLTFSGLSADSVYAVKGKLNGNIVIDAGENYKLDLELSGFSLRASSANPIFASTGSEVKITAKKDTKNYIYDERAAVDTTQVGVYGGAIHATADLEICGRGELFVQSANNNGIQTAKDLQVKNLSLVVECNDNALKGKDSVTVENCSTLLVAKAGDAIKTEATDISTTTSKQRGTVSILGGTHSIYAANDGVDAAYDVLIDSGSYIDDTTQKTVTVATVLNIYTDEYAGAKGSSGSQSSSSGASGGRTMYICNSSNSYKYSVKLSNDSASESEWVNPAYDKSVQSGRSTYYTYKFSCPSKYTKMQLYVYTSSQTQQNESSYQSKTDVISIRSDCDTYKYSSRNGGSWSWTNYASLSQQGGPGGGGPGGQGSSGSASTLAYSAKGIKAGNAITVNAGTITVKAVDDAIHADNTTVLENGKTPTGNLTVNGGDITVTGKDDGLHADGALVIKGGSVKVVSAYEGIEGNTIAVSGGTVSVTSSDDGFNATATSGTGLTVSGGTVYVYAGGDGVDSNSRASYSAIAFSGGNTVIISTSGGNSAIDSDGGYKYTGGKVLAVMPSGGMSSESTHCSNFSSIGKKQTISLSANAYATVKVNNAAVMSVKIPKQLSALAVYLGSSSASITSATSSAGTADANGVYWAA